MVLDNCDNVHDFLSLLLLCSPNLGWVTPKVKSVRKLSEDDVVTQRNQYKIQYKYIFQYNIRIYQKKMVMYLLLQIRPLRQLWSWKKMKDLLVVPLHLTRIQNVSWQYARAVTVTKLIRACDARGERMCKWRVRGMKMSTKNLPEEYFCGLEPWVDWSECQRLQASDFLSASYVR